MLDTEQIDALATLVEANRRLPRERRENFWFVHVVGEHRALVQGGGIVDHEPILFSDLEILESAGFISIRRERNYSGSFYITPQGFRFYEKYKTEAGAPLERVESHMKAYLGSERFGRKFKPAFEKWQRAEDLLWNADAGSQVSTVGHLLPGVDAEFAAAIEAPDAPDREKANTVARIRAALTAVPSGTDRAFLDALLAYWGTLSDLVMRLEHAGQKEGFALAWDDARRVVFHTAIVMVEIASAVEAGPAA